MPKLAILISGRGSNMRAIIDACNNGILQANVAVVISNNPEAAGLIYARNAGINTLVINHRDFKNREVFEMEIDKTLKDNNIDLVCLAGFMRIISPQLIGGWRGKIINIHPSLLPLYKGLHAQKQAIEAGAKESGCTVHYVTEEMDAGEIIMQKKVPVLADDNEETLAARILTVEHECYIDALKTIIFNL